MLSKKEICDVLNGSEVVFKTAGLKLRAVVLALRFGIPDAAWNIFINAVAKGVIDDKIYNDLEALIVQKQNPFFGGDLPSCPYGD